MINGSEDFADLNGRHFVLYTVGIDVPETSFDGFPQYRQTCRRYGAGTPFNTIPCAPFSVTLITEWLLFCITLGLPARDDNRDVAPLPSTPRHCMQSVAYILLP